MRRTSTSTKKCKKKLSEEKTLRIEKNEINAFFVEFLALCFERFLRICFMMCVASKRNFRWLPSAV